MKNKEELLQLITSDLNSVCQDIRTFNEQLFSSEMVYLSDAIEIIEKRIKECEVNEKL